MANYEDMRKRATDNILKLKNAWADADARNDEAGRQAAANAATQWYKQLRDNGDSIIADNLSRRNAEQARDYVSDYYAKQGRSAIRPYLYDKGAQYGLSKTDIDKALSYDNDTGEVTLGGRNIGKPAAVTTDGVSFWDNSTLDDVFNTYVSSTGKSKTDDSWYGRERDNLSGFYNTLAGAAAKDYMNYTGTGENSSSSASSRASKINPFTTDVGKSILGQYNLKAFNGGYNAAAAGAANNGGNIDSYSAANAMRQQAALYSQGQQAVLDWWKLLGEMEQNEASAAASKLNGAIQTLSNMGVFINDNVANMEDMKNGEYERTQGALDRDVARNATIAEVTGYNPASFRTAVNPYLNSDGTVANVEMDYQAAIDRNQKLLDEEYAKENPDWNKISRLEADNNFLAEARFKKTQLPEYSQYRGEGRLSYTSPTLARTQADYDNAFGYAQLKSAEKIAGENNALERYLRDSESADTRYKVDSDERTNMEGLASSERMIGLEADAEIAKNKAETDNLIRRDDNTSKNTMAEANNTSKNNMAEASHNANLLTGEVSEADYYNVINAVNAKAQSQFGKDVIVKGAGGTYMVSGLTDGATKFIVDTVSNMDRFSAQQQSAILGMLGVSDEEIAAALASK